MKDLRKGLIPLDEWNKGQRAKKYPRLTEEGIECPRCKAKVWKTNVFIIDDHQSPTRVVECQVCEHRDLMEL